MNAPIYRVFVLFVILFAVLVAWTSRWAVFDAKSLRDNPANRRTLLEEARIHRGLIKARDGTILARSVPAGGGTWRRTYSGADLPFSQAIGYSFTNLGRAGLELSRNDALTGRREEISSILDELQGKKRVGDDVITTLDPQAQRVALSDLGGRKGAVVALEPDTGRVRVMATVPGFNPNQVATDFRHLIRDPGSPLLNRTTQAGYPPGSTFKVVTAIAAIDSGQYQPSSTVNGDNGHVISGVPLQNDGGKDWGPINLVTALTFSVNTVWAQIAEKLGKSTMADYMTRLGFYAKPPLDYPPHQKRASGEYYKGRLLAPTSGLIDVGRMGIGQDKLEVTPLQMAMVAAAVANHGKLMRPRLTDKVIDPDGRVVQNVHPSEMSTVMKSSTAAKVTTMMGHVVREGTGTAAALSGIEVAGKTGTAEVGRIGANITQPWFIAFAPIDHPKVAVAVTVERSVGGFGGTVAAPIAKDVMESLLH